MIFHSLIYKKCTIICSKKEELTLTKPWWCKSRKSKRYLSSSKMDKRESCSQSKMNKLEDWTKRPLMKWEPYTANLTYWVHSSIGYSTMLMIFSYSKNSSQPTMLLTPSSLTFLTRSTTSHWIRSVSAKHLGDLTLENQDFQTVSRKLPHSNKHLQTSNLLW